MWRLKIQFMYVFRHILRKNILLNFLLFFQVCDWPKATFFKYDIEGKIKKSALNVYFLDMYLNSYLSHHILTVNLMEKVTSNKNT